jgi:hypothetical protein
MAKLVLRDMANAERNKASRFDIYEGLGAPEGVVTGKVGDLYIQRDGASGQTLFTKGTGHQTNTGWVVAGSGGGGSLSQEKHIYISTGGETEVTLPFDIESGDIIHVYKNGVNQDEGGSYEYTLNYSTNKVVFNNPLASLARVKVIKLST